MDKAAIYRSVTLLSATVALCASFAAGAQVPVDENGYAIEPLGAAEGPADYAEAPVAASTLTDAELQELVGPIALYPDDLLAIVLPASTYPLEIVQAARFLEELENDSSLEPSEEWDESVVALLNYPEVLRMMDEDIDWTWQLGQAVIDQQPDVIAAVEQFRDRAYAAGNLKTDEHQEVRREDDIIEIVPIEDDVIYVPYYEPEEVVVYQPRRVYYYYPAAYPVYYYPYPVGYSFYSGYFWGVTTAFHIGWSSNYLHVYHPTYWGHPYYGHTYYGHYYRRPSVTVYNTTYVNNTHYSVNRYRDGDYWAPRRGAGARPGHYYSDGRHTTYTRSGQRLTNSYRDRDSVRNDRYRDVNPGSNRSGGSLAARNDRRRDVSGGSNRSGGSVAHNDRRRDPNANVGTDRNGASVARNDGRGSGNVTRSPGRSSDNRTRPSNRGESRDTARAPRSGSGDALRTRAAAPRATRVARDDTARVPPAAISRAGNSQRDRRSTPTYRQPTVAGAPRTERVATRPAAQTRASRSEHVVERRPVQQARSTPAPARSAARAERQPAARAEHSSGSSRSQSAPVARAERSQGRSDSGDRGRSRTRRHDK